MIRKIRLNSPTKPRSFRYHFKLHNIDRELKSVIQIVSNVITAKIIKGSEKSHHLWPPLFTAHNLQYGSLKRTAGSRQRRFIHLTYWLCQASSPFIIDCYCRIGLWIKILIWDFYGWELQPPQTSIKKRNTKSYPHCSNKREGRGRGGGVRMGCCTHAELWK